MTKGQNYETIYLAVTQSYTKKTQKATEKIRTLCTSVPPLCNNRKRS